MTYKVKSLLYFVCFVTSALMYYTMYNPNPEFSMEQAELAKAEFVETADEVADMK
jgi:hypothetical protein